MTDEQLESWITFAKLASKVGQTHCTVFPGTIIETFEELLKFRRGSDNATVEKSETDIDQHASYEPALD